MLGSPVEAAVALRAIVSAGFQVALVVSQPDARRGRGAAATPTPLKAAALELGLPVTDRLEEVTTAGVDLGVVVAYGRLVPTRILAEVPMVNLHFSLLPRWRGAAPVERAILAGDDVTGACVMRLEPQLDTGAVFDRVEVRIGPDETAAQLRSRLADLGAEALVTRLAEGFGEPGPQEGQPVYAPKIEAPELRIDWGRPAGQVHRLVRVGGAWTTFRSRRLKVLEVRVPPGLAPGGTAPEGAVPGRPSLGPGELSGALVGTGDGLLELVTVQPESRGPMEAEAWLRGSRPDPGEHLGP